MTANTDMHHHNLSVFTRGTWVIGLAPAYDMGPMHFAPRAAHLVDEPFQPPLPRPDDADLWHDVWRAAMAFWQRVANATQLSEGFRTLAARAGESVAALEPLRAMLPRG